MRMDLLRHQSHFLEDLDHKEAYTSLLFPDPGIPCSQSTEDDLEFRQSSNRGS